ncbi:Yip1 domain protein [Tritonibacter multivorans]|uniref:Yip1 domain protein n=1 Tax=Tritonibacter multivorans TaxID=928856 RepID=A0A0P1GJN2_9RHOB|nr:YIP1 family protein [Tritonibacter multivorans]MDA7421484.1 YIP1 family protein [Tritonibacter multivorans]CUH82311.1 Yip1 domain protein [Tritonibacter multivorans]SFC98353.1 Yip1 domain-containing protein [Tritonibacter multivorans]
MTDLKALVAETIFSPATAGKRLLDMQLGRQAIVSMFALSLVVAAILEIVQRLIVPLPEEFMAAGVSPVTFILIVGGMQLAIVAAMTGVGRWLGGRAGMLDLLGLQSWLTLVSLMFQTVAVLLLIVSPLLAGLLNLAVVIYGFYVALHFVNVAHGFESLMKSFGVVAMSACSVAMMLLILSGI